MKNQAVHAFSEASGCVVSGSEFWGNYSGGDCRGEVRLARTPFWARGHWSACAGYGRLINRPYPAQADTWREAPDSLPDIYGQGVQLNARTAWFFITNDTN